MTAPHKQLPPDLYPAIEELPGDLARLARIIEDVCGPGSGVKTVLKVAEQFRSTAIYCHNVDALFRKARDRWIVESYDHGGRVPDLARECGLSERRVWEILGRPPEDDRQIKLF